MARTDSKWKTLNGGTAIQTIAPNGYDILINGSDHYLNFGSDVGATGYGIRDNGGTMEFKNSGGSWTAMGSGGGGSVNSVSGTAGRITSTGGTDPVIDIDATYAGQTSIVTLGTVTTGTWQGTAITVSRGGTGNTSLTAYAVLCGGTTSTNPVQALASLGTAGQVLTSNGAGALPSFQNVAGTGTVTSVDVTTANGVSATGGPITGSGSFTFTLGAITPTSVNGLTITSSTGTLTIANGKTATVNNTLTFTGTDGSSVAFGAGGTVAYLTTRLDQFAVPTASVSFNGQQITNVMDPTNPQDAATKAYTDTFASGIQWKALVDEATAAALPACTYANGTAGVGATLTGNAVGVLTVDGETVLLNHRVLVKDQVSGEHNGIYLCTTEGTGGVAFVLTRATDSDTPAELVGAACAINAGTANAGKAFIQTAPATITIGTTVLSFVQFFNTAYSGTTNRITVTGGTIDISASYVGQASITTLGTITTGTWNAGVISPVYGGTGVANNAASTLTISGNFATTLTVSGVTGVTLPTSGTLYGTAAGSITSAQLASSLTDETGTGLVVFNTAPTFASTMTIGTAGGTTGATNYKGTTSGTVTLTVAAAAGTWTMTLPTSGGTSGYVLSTNGSGVTSWVAQSGGGSSTLTDGHIFVGDGTNTATDVAMSGDITIINTGATTIGANKVIYTKGYNGFQLATVAAMRYLSGN